MKKNLLGISLITMTGLYVLLSAFIILITILIDQPVIYGIGISAIILVIQFLISPFFTDLSMEWFYKAKFDYEIPTYLKKFIEEVCQKENMKYPRIGFIDDGAPNAFTYGHTKNDARIVITRGILELLTEDEVKAVVAHELGHAVHYDMLFMTVAQLVPLVLYGIYTILMKTNKNNSSSNKNDGAIIALIAYILYVISNYVVLWLSRTREYYADSYSIETTKNPNSLASALVKVGYGLTTSNSTGKNKAPKSIALGIFDSNASKSLVVSSYENGEASKDNIKQAMKWEQWNIWAKWYELHSTHPLISKRLLYISNRSEEFKQKPYIKFDLKKDESYVDDFIVELIINFLPPIMFVVGLIITSVLANKDKINLAILSMGITLLLTLFTSFIKFNRRHPDKDYKDNTVRDLLSEVKVSNITAIPCQLEGKVIGRGDPGYVFNEDMTIQDKTGIMFLDYNQPLFVVNKLFAIFKNKDNIDKTIKVKGWYRRSPVPYVEIKSYEIDGKVKKVYTYPLAKAFYVIGFIISIAIIIGSFI